MSLRDSFGAAKNHKTLFTLNVNTYNKFYLNLGVKVLFRLRSESSKVVLMPNEYLNIYCIIISLRDSLRPPKSVKKSLRAETKSFSQVVP